MTGLGRQSGRLPHLVWRIANKKDDEQGTQELKSRTITRALSGSSPTSELTPTADCTGREAKFNTPTFIRIRTTTADTTCQRRVGSLTSLDTARIHLPGTRPAATERKRRTPVRLQGSPSRPMAGCLPTVEAECAARDPGATWIGCTSTKDLGHLNDSNGLDPTSGRRRKEAKFSTRKAHQDSDDHGDLTPTGEFAVRRR